VRTASTPENEDLFWAVRGGGGNFGVVTSFKFQLHPIRTVYVGIFFYELDAAGDLLRFFREFITDAPEEYGGSRRSRLPRRWSSFHQHATATHSAPRSSIGPAR
jgi:FAD/FMN-containing dehydrogenase